MLKRRIQLFVERLDARDLPAVMGPNVLVPSLPMLAPAATMSAPTSTPTVLPAGTHAATPVPSEILPTSGLIPALPTLAASTIPALPATIPSTTIVSNVDTSAALYAQSIASRSAVSSSHQLGVENDLSPLAEAPEGIAVWETTDPFERFR